ncbi:hypothetical protein Tco_1437667 [Tanacetum coccineum]
MEEEEEDRKEDTNGGKWEEDRRSLDGFIVSDAVVITLRISYPWPHRSDWLQLLRQGSAYLRGGCALTDIKQPYRLLPETLLAPATHIDPRDPYVAARDAATAPATDNDDSPTQKETSPSEPQGSPPRDS